MGLSQCVGWCTTCLPRPAALPGLNGYLRRLGTEALGDDTDKQGLVDLMNELIKHQWPYMNEWFQAMMKAQVEPQLARLSIQGLLDFRFGDTVTLGTVPFKLSVHQIDTFEQESPSNPNEPPFDNIIVFSYVDWQGNASVDVRLGGNVELSLHSIHMKGLMIVELVKLSTTPPWFSGIRMYMPDLPELDMQVKSKIFGSVVNFHGEAVASAVKKALLNAFSKQLVLPNCFAASVGDRLDTFNTKAIRPEGVLRISLLSVEDLQVSEKRYSQWRSSSSSRRKSHEITVKVSLGAANKHFPATILTPDRTEAAWGQEAFLDFVVTRPKVQMAKFTLHDDCLMLKAQSEVSVTDLIEQYCDNEERESVRLQADDGSSCVLYFKVEWKVFSQVMTPRPWAIGECTDLNWMLIVDILHATGLPKEGCDVAHWVSAGFSRKDQRQSPKKQENGRRSSDSTATKAWAEQQTLNAYARLPAEQGLLLLRKLRLSSDLQTVLGLDLNRSNHMRSLALAEAFWKERLKSRQAPDFTEQHSTDHPDAVWDFPCFYHLDGTWSGRLMFNVYRRRYKSDASNHNPCFVGSAELNIESLGFVSASDRLVSLPLKEFETRQAEASPSIHVRVTLRSLERGARPPVGQPGFELPKGVHNKKATFMSGLKQAASLWMRKERGSWRRAASPYEPEHYNSERGFGSERDVLGDRIHSGGSTLDGTGLLQSALHELPSPTNAPHKQDSSRSIGSAFTGRGSSHSPRRVHGFGDMPAASAHPNHGSDRGEHRKGGVRAFLKDKVKQAAADIDARRTRHGASQSLSPRSE